MAASIDVVYSGPDAGKYGVASNWTPPQVPNNGSGNTYNVSITSVTPILDLNAAIANLHLTSVGGLNVANHSLVVTGATSNTSSSVDGLMVNASTADASASLGSLSNFSGNTLGGLNLFTVTAASGHTATLSFNNANIVNLSAYLDLSGPGARVVDQNNLDALRNLAHINAQARLTLEGGRNLTIGGDFGLTADGAVSVFDNSKLVIAGNLTNYSSGTLTGGELAIRDQGTIQFNGADITTNASSIFINGGGAKITDEIGRDALRNIRRNTGSLIIFKDFTTAGDFTNDGGLQVGNNGASFTISGNLTNLTGTTLTGGFYTVAGVGGGGTLRFNNANIVTNAADVTLLGSGSRIIDQSGQDALRNFSYNAAGARFGLISRDFATSGDFTNDGTLSVSDGQFTINGKLTNFSGTTLASGTYLLGGNGQIKFNGANIITNSATLAIAPGAFIFDENNKSALRDLAANTATGSFTLNGNSLPVSGSFTNAGQLFINSGGSFSVPAASQFTQTGGTTTLGGGSLGGGSINLLAGKLTGRGTLSGAVTSGATIAPGNAAFNNVHVPGTFAFDADLTLTATSRLSMSIGPLPLLPPGFPNPTSDLITVMHTATLDLNLVNSFTPGPGDTFTLLSAGFPLTGSFSNATNGARITTDDGSASFLVTYNGKTLTLSDYHAVPEPSAFLPLAVVALLWRRRVVDSAESTGN
jgi:hypothetical protein